MGHGGDGPSDPVSSPCDSLSIDRSKVHVLLCDKDPNTARHVVKLLQDCLYQVTAVKSAGQVMELLDSCSYQIDLILTEVELPKEKGFKMLKHIVRQEQLRRIPVVMMSVQDEMAVVVKCLRLGAVDYLLKPLRTNELLNLWTHMWRRRRMLGLTEKHSINGKFKVPFDLLVSETSESNNTNSTNLFSDDTDDLKRAISTHGANDYASGEMESEMSPQLELSLKPSMSLAAEVAPRNYPKAGLLLSAPKKTELKLGQSSAFLTYARVSNQSSERKDKQQSDKASNNTTDLRPNVQSVSHENDEQSVKESELVGLSNQHNMFGVPLPKLTSPGPCYAPDNTESACRSKNECVRAAHKEKLGTSCYQTPLPCELTGESNQVPSMIFCGYNEGPVNVAAMPPLPISHFPAGAVVNSSLHVPTSLLPPPTQLYHGLLRDDGTCIAPGAPTMQSHPSSQGLSLTGAFSYYPFGLRIATPQLRSFPGWPAIMATPVIDRKLGQAERREAALKKYRRKRIDRCFEKKIRYVSRKKLAEQRPRIRGQFVRRSNDSDMIENGVLDEYDEDEDDDEQGLDNAGAGSSIESVAEDA